MRKGHKDLASALLGTAVLFGLAFGRGWPSADPASNAGKLPIRLAYFPNLTHAPALIGVGHGDYARDLPRAVIQSRVVNAGPEAMEALLAGEVDLAFVGPSPAINTYLKSGGKALRIVSGACSGGASLVVEADAKISGVADLDGKTVAVPGLGGTQDVSCRYFLAQNGLSSREKGGTVSILPLKNPDILTMFRRHQIDAAWVPEPWASRLRDEAGAKAVVDERSLWPNHRFTTTVLVARSAFALAHPEVVRDFVRSHERVVTWMLTHPGEAQEASNRELKRLSGKALSALVLKEAWTKLDFTTDPDVASINVFAQAARSAGYLKVARLDLAGLVKPDALMASEAVR